MNNIVSIAAILWGVYVSYSGFAGSIVVDNNFWIQAAGSILGGLGFLGYSNKAKVMEFIEKFTGKSIVNPEVSVPNEPAVSINQDHAAIHHIMARVVALKSEQGIKLCKELNSVLFELQYKLNE